MLGIALLAALVASLQWLFRLAELEQHRKIKDWEFTTPIGILVLVIIVGVNLIIARAF